MARGDLGTSIVTNQPVAGELFSALGNTLMLALPAAVLGFSLGDLLGALAAYYSGTMARQAVLRRRDHRREPAALLGRHRARGDLRRHPQRAARPGHGAGAASPRTWEQVKHLILPVFTLSLIPMGVVSRLVRANVLEIRPGVRGGPARQGPARRGACSCTS